MFTFAESQASRVQAIFENPHYDGLHIEQLRSYLFNNNIGHEMKAYQPEKDKGEFHFFDKSILYVGYHNERLLVGQTDCIAHIIGQLCLAQQIMPNTLHIFLRDCRIRYEGAAPRFYFMDGSVLITGLKPEDYLSANTEI